MNYGRLRLCSIFALVIITLPQFRPINSSGISAAYIGLFYSDKISHDAFWSALGGTPATLGQRIVSPVGEELTLITKFPGITIYGLGGSAARGNTSAMAAPPPSGNSQSRIKPPVMVAPEASSYQARNQNVIYIAFKAKNLSAVTARLRSVGVLPLGSSTAQATEFMSPNGIRVRVSEDATLTDSIRSDEISLRVASAVETAQWYQKVLGARIAAANGTALAEIPGLNIRFVDSRDAKRTTLTHTQQERLGFEASSGLGALLQRLSSQGVMITVPSYAISEQFHPFKAFARLQDPLGTVIELTDGFQAAVR